jgi:hypothetical protein
MRSASSSTTGRNDAPAAARPTQPSTPNRKIRPAKPRNVDADR